MCFTYQHTSIWKSHIAHTQHSHVAGGPPVRRPAGEEPHVGRERLPGPCLRLCPKYLVLCLRFNKHSVNSFEKALDNICS